MSAPLELLLYLPVTLAVLGVLEACRYDDPRSILRRTFRNFAALTAVLVIGCAAIYVLMKYF